MRAIVERKHMFRDLFIYPIAFRGRNRHSFIPGRYFTPFQPQLLHYCPSQRRQGSQTPTPIGFKVKNHPLRRAISIASLIQSIGFILRTMKHHTFILLESSKNSTLDYSFDDSYKGTPPWDIGRPQSELVNLEKCGEVIGSVLDVGCGTGENSLFFASSGHDAVGVDSSIRAIRKAQTKAKERKIERATFLVLDVLKLSELNKRFDNAIDSGLFHTFSDTDRVKFVSSLRSTLKSGGTYSMLCFSELEPTNWGGPRRVSQEEIILSFSEGWKINYIKDANFDTNFHQHGAKAWLSSITRL